MTKELKAIRDALDAAAYQMEFLPKKMEIINKAYEALDRLIAVAPDGWMPIDQYTLKEREDAVFRCKFENTVWLNMVGYMRYSGGDKNSPFIVIPCQDSCGRRTHITHWMPLPAAPKHGGEDA